MAHRYVLKDDYWKMRISHPYSMLCASDHLAATCGQAPIGEYGDVLFAGDLEQQSSQVIETMDRILGDAGMQRKDIERVVVFTSEHEKSLRESCMERFRQQAPGDATLYEILLPPLFYDDLLLEVDYYAIPDRHVDHAVQSFSLSLNIDPAAKSFSEQQGVELHQKTQALLRDNRLDFSDIVKLSCYAPCKNEAFWNSLAEDRNKWFDGVTPALSEVVTESSSKNRLIADVTCVNKRDWGPTSVVGSILERGNPEAIRIGPLFFSSALFYTSSTTEESLSVTNEVNAIMERHGELLANEGLAFEDVVKATTFYDGAGSADALHENMSARNAYYSVPGPGSTGLPVSGFPRSNVRTSIELIASSQVHSPL